MKHIGDQHKSLEPNIKRAMRITLGKNAVMSVGGIQKM